jgi:site-specific DNA-methyltransferase (adenine-specific)
MEGLHNIDCLELMKTMEDNSVDLVILDPPYNVNAADWDKIPNYLPWMQEVLDQSFRVIKPSGSLYLWGMSKNNDFLRMKLYIDDNHLDYAFKNWIVWVHDVKIHKKLEDKYLTKHEDLLFYAGKGNTFNQVRDLPPDFQLKMHKGRYDENFFIEREKLPPSQQAIFKNGLQLGSPAKSWWKGPANQSASKKIKKFAGYKSEWVCDRIVEVSSNPGDLILVPFAGTGTECLSANRLGRRYIGMEIDKERFDLAKERIACNGF